MVDGSGASWYARRFNALLVGFPQGLTVDTLPPDVIGERERDDVFDGLVSAHTLLTGVSAGMLTMGDTEGIDTVVSRLHLLWLLGCLGRVVVEDNSYGLVFDKATLVKHRTLRVAPKNIAKAFELLEEHGVWVAFTKDGAVSRKQAFGACDGGTVHFDGRATALGLSLFCTRLLLKRWYWEEDKAGNYAEGGIKPILHCIEPFYRAPFLSTLEDHERRIPPEQVFVKSSSTQNGP